MERRFLDFLKLAVRTQKPRTRGLTIIGEDGQPIPWIREMLEAWGEYVDGVKFNLTHIYMPWRVVEAKVKLYREFNVFVALDDPTFAVAYYQGKAKELLQTVRDLGFTHVQVDTQHVDLGSHADTKKEREDEAYYMALARELGLRLEGEVGHKYSEGDRSRTQDGLLSVEFIVAEMKRLLAAGCDHVTLESRVIRTAIGSHGEKEQGTVQIRQIANLIGQDNIFIEITRQLPFDTQQCHRFWAVRNFGPDVNIGGSMSITDVRYLEAVRRGTTFVNVPSRSSSALWIMSLARNHRLPPENWWKDEIQIDPELFGKSA